MTTSLDLLDLVYEAIVSAGTDAQERVHRPGDWPTQLGGYPRVKLRLIAEDRQSLGRSGPAEFTTTATIRAIGEVSAPAQLDNGGALAAETNLWALKAQIDAAVVGSYPLMAEIQQISSMRSQLAFNADGATHLAGVQIDFALEFYEGPEDFPPPPSWPLDEVDLRVAGTVAGILESDLQS